LKKLLIYIFLAISFPTIAQDLVYDDFIYVDNIKTAKLSHKGVETSLPIIDLSQRFAGQLLLEWDDLDGGFKEHTYKIIHCDKDWKPSDLDEIEYIDGFNNEEIDEFAYSVNGYSDYTHYELMLPNDDIKWTISGNYIVIIYDADLQLPVLSRRFMVAENRIGIGYQLVRPKNVQKSLTHHELEIVLSYNDFRIRQPREELYVSVLQNGNWNSAIHNLYGTYERNNKLFFDQYDMISFPALKEFRSFDIRPISYTTEFVNSIDQGDDETTVLLDLNKKRSNRNALTLIDANGFFIIDNFESRSEPKVSSEYCKVVFNLQSEREFERDIYMIGAFSDWQAKEEYRLEYDAVKGLYLGAAYFKQGYYDYMFAMEQEDGFLDIDLIEGSSFETENDYQVLVYYREYGARFDRLVGVKNITANPNN